MNIASLSMDMSQISLQNKLQLSLVKMVSEDNNELSEQMNNMIDNMAVDMNIGTKIDVRC